MTYRVEIGAEALAGLAAVFEYGIEAFGDQVAISYLRDLHRSVARRSVARLAEHPFSAAFHPWVAPPVRALSYRSHRIFYDVVGECVILRRIVHKAMDAGRWL